MSGIETLAGGEERGVRLVAMVPTDAGVGVGRRWAISAPAKLNLGLRVYSLGEESARQGVGEGFHAIESWMAPISWHDTVTVTLGEHTEGLTLRVTGRAAGVPVEIEKNLVGRAALALAKARGVQARGEIELHKVLPPGGGLGGGSSDAGRALVALNAAWELGFGEDKLEDIAAGLGSDVALFVRAQAALCTGRGEVMTPLPAKHPLYAVLILPPGGCGTKEVYAAFDVGRRGEGKWEEGIWQRYAAATADELNEVLINDLEAAAFFVAPWLGALRDMSRRFLGRPVHMTGSGSTLFTLCGSGAEAGELAERLQQELKEEVGVVSVKILRQ